jgi:hypothetical protein
VALLSYTIQNFDTIYWEMCGHDEPSQEVPPISVDIKKYIQNNPSLLEMEEAEIRGHLKSSSKKSNLIFDLYNWAVRDAKIYDVKQNSINFTEFTVVKTLKKS